MKKYGFIFFSILICLRSIAQTDGDTLPIVHDPVMIQEGNKYYLFSTGWGIDLFSSSDKKHWKKEASVFPKDQPAWAQKLIPSFKGHIWAPDISFHNGQYYLYYAISAFAKNTSVIGVATNTTLDSHSPKYKWIDHGLVLQSIPGKDDWNAIDPNLIFDEKGTPWLDFGSFWNGLKMVQMDPSLTKIATPEKWYTIAARERSFGIADTLPGDAAVEAPFIFHKNGYFYLFVSFDYCCRGEKSTYHVKVGRSKSIEGPYLDENGKSMADGGGTEVIGADERFYAAGHNAVVNLSDGDYFVCHGYDRKDNGAPKLIIKKISWQNDWPTLK
ncbi:arabinan endo-1,5-alpha-L-arabinosidase [Rhizosphaericola mali]|uniref:Arabinan endo-1,5-alpha-L-arabinosidase n=1 Tax=Rhizosphaericola mali TaxID=2545455 RepID=A0A5P2G637_9BACT|nr:arabinan endo-1,5-alpha-L-arabinosidase [Rhizosphaericola mali]QES88643.1 arabinan endo-1,5-alpha-L-arabinosidase [Rhizosphaericola mali]